MKMERLKTLACCALTLMYCTIGHANFSRTLNIELNRGTVLDISQNTESVFMTDPSIANFHMKSLGTLYIYTKKIGSTTLYLTDRKTKETKKYLINVYKDFSVLNQLFKKLFPDSAVTINTAGDNLVIKGTVHSSATASDMKQIAEKYVGDPNKIISLLKVDAPTQVNLHVQIVEMSREMVRSLGIDWNGDFSTPHSQIKINPFMIPAEFIASGTDATKFTNSTMLSGLLKRGNITIQAAIDILEKNGLVTILSEPNLTALSGETASFLVGGEFPIPIPQGNTGSVTVMFKKFGVSLAFTPTILETGKINLQVRPEISELSSNGAVNINGFQIPSLSTRRAQTTVELKSGQSFSIAGLLQNNANKVVQQLPGLGSLPVLGQLFRSESFKRNETELVIIVTPYLVHAGGNHDYKLPTKNANASVTASFSTFSNNTTSRNINKKG